MRHGTTGTGVPAAALLRGLEQTKEGFALTDAEGLFIYMNHQHLTMFGFAELSEVRGRSWRILYDDAVAGMIEREVFPQLIKTGAWSGHVLARRRDGRTFNEDLTLSLMPEGGIVCNCRDRTKELEMAERTAHSEKLLRGFMEHMPAAVAIEDAEGRFMYVNPEFCRLAGHPPETLLGRTTKGLVPETMANVETETHAQVLAGSSSVAYDLPTTDHRVYLMQKFALRGLSGAIECICVIGSDVTDSRRLETETRRTLARQAELILMQRDFVGMVSHEFRTPLAAMRATLYLLRKLLTENATPKIKRYLDLQEEAVVNLVDLVDQVLALNRIEDATGEVERKPVELPALLSIFCQSLNETTAGFRLVVDLPPAGDSIPTVMANKELLVAALGNLISNGLKYSPSDKPVRVGLVPESEGWCIHVRDEGRGIPAQDQKRLFEPFFRAGNVGTIPGSGLGLRIARRTADLHGGSMTFESVEDRGSTFSMHLPAPAEQTTPPYKT